MKTNLKRIARVRIKAHPKRSQILRAYRQINRDNQKMASSIDVEKLLLSGKATMLDVDNNGVVHIEPFSPNHQRWLED